MTAEEKHRMKSERKTKSRKSLFGKITSKVTQASCEIFTTEAVNCPLCGKTVVGKHSCSRP